MPDEADRHAESVRRALDDFLGRLARAVVDGLADRSTSTPTGEGAQGPPAEQESEE